MNGYAEFEPVADQFFQLPYVPYDYGIVPVDESPSRQPTATTNQGPSYETPWYVDSINRAIERAAQVATVNAAGYPPYPTFPSPSPAPVPMPMPVPSPGVQQQSSGGIQLSQTTLMLIVGGFLLFTLGKRGR